jgi:uncharacterized protein YjbI with pentapeptide repeats
VSSSYSCRARSKVDLSRANLRGAILSGAYFESTSSYNDEGFVQWADLSHADLSGANLSHAYLLNANLSYANLRTPCRVLIPLANWWEH